MHKKANKVVKHIWELNFDLDTKKLQNLYPGKDWRQAYDDIRNFLKNNNFEHRQGSGYISTKSLYEVDVINTLYKLAQTYTWIYKCSTVFDKSIADNRVNCKNIFRDAVRDLNSKKEKANAQEDKDNTQEKTDDKQSVKENSQEKKENAKEKPTQKFMYSRKKLNQKAQEIAKQPQQTTDKAKSKNKNIDI